MHSVPKKSLALRRQKNCWIDQDDADKTPDIAEIELRITASMHYPMDHHMYMCMDPEESLASPKQNSEKDLTMKCIKLMYAYATRVSNLPDLIDKWQAKEVTGREVKDQTEGNNDGQRVSGMTFGPFNESIFMHFVDNPEKSPLPGALWYSDEDMIIIPNNKSFRRRDETGSGGKAAAMSRVHFLVIPKKRIYNLVSLTKADLPLLRRMQEKAKEIYMSEAVTEYYDAGALKEHRIPGFRRLRKAAAECKISSSERAIDYLSVAFLHFFLHPHPLHSVGQLHMHCCIVNKMMWSRRGNDFHSEGKNIPVQIVKNVIENDLVNKVINEERKGRATLSPGASAIGLSPDAV
jgi:hypothetical protein